ELMASPKGLPVCKKQYVMAMGKTACLPNTLIIPITKNPLKRNSTVIKSKPYANSYIAIVTHSGTPSKALAGESLYMGYCLMNPGKKDALMSIGSMISSI